MPRQERSVRGPGPDRRRVLSAGGAGVLGITTLALPTAAASASLVPASSSGAAGTPEDPILIGTLADLEWLAADPVRWTAHYRQVADIEAAPTGTDVAGGGDGLTPIGTLANGFTGGYDGDGFRISNLAIDRPTGDFVGLFGYADGATITDVVLVDAAVRGRNRVGALLGYARNATTVSGCHASGAVTIVTQYGGGLIGSVGYGPTVTGCSATVAVTGQTTATSGNRGVGGLVGTIESNAENDLSTIARCFATGAVSGSNGVGGLVGWMRGRSEILDAYATGAVTRTTGSATEFGAFLGSTDGTNAIARCYAAGAVTYDGATDPTDKGFVGGTRSTPSDPTYTADFFDSDTSGQTSGTGATARTTAQLGDPATFAGWDLTTVWELAAGTNIGRPILRSNPPRA